jgi:hypothetical protein
MALQPVKPGDLIKADEWNKLLEDMRLLESRVATLESNAERVEIIDLQFTAPLRVGDLLHISGRNFRTATRTARAFIDGREALPDPNTFSTSRMDIAIPDEVAPPAGGKQVQLLVSNVLTNDTRRLTVLPREIVLDGPIDVQWVGVQPATITANGDIYWEYTARSRASRTATFTIVPRVIPEGLLRAAQFQVLNADRTTPLRFSQISLDPKEEALTRFFLRVNPFPAIDRGTRFSLFIELSVGGRPYTASDPESFTVAEPTEQPDPNITLTTSKINPETDPAGNPIFKEPNILQFREGVQLLQVQLLVVFIAQRPYQPARYQLTTGTLKGWSIEHENAAVYTVEEAEWVSMENNNESRVSRTLTYFIQPTDAAAERALTVTLQREGVRSKQEINLILRPQ